MKIVIDIDENVFTRLFDNGTEDYAIVNDDLFAIAKSIRNGTPLPKGHGRIIDESKINTIYCETEMELYGSKIRYIKKTDAPTIIEGSDSE